MTRIVFLLAGIIAAVLLSFTGAAYLHALSTLANQGRPASFDWAIQGKDDAISGCPGRYSQWTEVNGREYLLGCWGHQ